MNNTANVELKWLWKCAVIAMCFLAGSNLLFIPEVLASSQGYVVSNSGSCTSAAKVASDGFRQLSNVVKKYKLDMPAKRLAGLNCSPAGLSEALVGSRSYKYARKCSDIMSSIYTLKIVPDMVHWWNNANHNSWATIGPRKLELNRPERGRLVSHTGRLFISPYPILSDTVTLNIKKLGGKAKTHVTICSHAPGDRNWREGSVIFDSGKRNKGANWPLTIRNVKGKYIAVHLTSKSMVNTFQYQVSASGSLVQASSSGTAAPAASARQPRTRPWHGLQPLRGRFGKPAPQQQVSHMNNRLFAQCIDRNTEVAVQVDMTRGIGNLYLKGNSVFNLTAKYLSIRGSTPDNLIELKGNGFRKMYLNKGRKILYFRDGNRGEFCKVRIQKR